MKTRKVMGMVASILLSVLLLVGVGAAGELGGFTYFPHINAPRHLFVINLESMNTQELVMIQTLQGILAQEKPQIYVDEAGSYHLWLTEMEKEEITSERHEYPWWFIEHFLSSIDGYILYKEGNDSINVATSLAGILKGIAVEESIAQRAEEYGLKCLKDVREKTEQWCWENFQGQFTTKLIMEQRESKPHLRDYAVATKAFTFFEGSEASFRSLVMDAIDEDAPLLGWGPGQEDSHVDLGTKRGLFTVATDWCLNLSTLAGVKGIKPKQKHVTTIKPEENVHYVTFLMSDGDNVQWILGNFADHPDYFGNPNRGKFPMGWTFPPTLADLAPTALNWFYEKAKDDFFVTGISGVGYMHPGTYPTPALEKHTQRLNSYLEKADMKIAVIKDPAFFTEEGFGKFAHLYAEQPNLLGGFYFTGSEYAGGGGRIMWVEGKPFVSVWASLWMIHTGAIASGINLAPRDPKSPQGYTLINVHPWTHTLDHVVEVISRLDPHVRVVGPEEFILLMYYNLKGELPEGVSVCK